MARNKSDFFSFFFLACLTLEGGTDGLSQNIGNDLVKALYQTWLIYMNFNVFHCGGPLSWLD